MKKSALPNLSTLILKSVRQLLVLILFLSSTTSLAAEVWTRSGGMGYGYFPTAAAYCQVFQQQFCHTECNPFPMTCASPDCSAVGCTVQYRVTPATSFLVATEIILKGPLPAGETINKTEKTLGSPAPEQCVGNPIDIATGNKYQKETDYVDSRTSQIVFERYYNSIAIDDSLTGNQSSRALGNNWKHTYQRSIFNSDDGIDEGVAIAYRHTGRVENFFLNTSTNQWVPDADITSRLIQLTDSTGDKIGWEYTTEQDVVETYNATGVLQAITNRNGVIQTLHYDLVSGLLTSITDSYGNSMSFTYDLNDRIQTMTDLDGKLYQYTYSPNLIQVVYPDETPQNNVDNPIRVYHYEEANKTLLTGITDENGNRFASWDYDDTTNKAILSEHNSGVDRVTVTYNNDSTTTIIDALGASDTFTFLDVQGVSRVSNVAGDQCNVCGAQAQAYTYDSNGFVASETDFEGNLTTFINNSRGLQTSRTEAVGTLEERTITTEWHPDFRLPTKITEPGKETIFTYDAQGRLLSRTEREI